MKQVQIYRNSTATLTSAIPLHWLTWLLAQRSVFIGAIVVLLICDMLLTVLFYVNTLLPLPFYHSLAIGCGENC